TLQVSRDKESEADKVGTEISSKAGYDPAGLRNFLQFLAAVPVAPQTKQALGLWGSTHPPLNERINSLNALLPGFSADGQKRAKRSTWSVNPPASAHAAEGAGAATPTPSAANELDGVVMKGVVVITGGKLPDGTKVKVRPQ